MDAALWNTAMVDRVTYQRGIDQSRTEAASSGKVTAMLASRKGPPEA